MQDLLPRLYRFLLLVRGAVAFQLIQAVLVVDHEPAGVGHAPGGGVAPPVDPPESGTVAQVEVGHGTESQAPVLLAIEVARA